MLEWTFIPKQGNVSLAEYEFYNTDSTLDQVAMVGVFKTRLIDKDPLVSTATLDDVLPTHNGTVLMCANTALENRKPDQIAKITILVDGKLLTSICPVPCYTALNWNFEHVMLASKILTCIGFQVLLQLH